ncbi:MAG: DeoR family transcriptional regulator, partial [Ruminococcus sp.]|nr:DeoR family transcriptional regulator [Ruminococcus sp.]
NFAKKKSNAERKKERSESVETAFSGVEQDGSCKLSELAEYLGVTEKTVRSRLKEHGGFWIEDGECGLKK